MKNSDALDVFETLNQVASDLGVEYEDVLSTLMQYLVDNNKLTLNDIKEVKRLVSEYMKDIDFK